MVDKKDPVRKKNGDIKGKKQKEYHDSYIMVEKRGMNWSKIERVPFGLFS